MTLTTIPVEPIALLVALPLALSRGGGHRITRRRRFAVGLGHGGLAWFAVWYPNFSALPLPSAVVNAYQGVLPTYLYAFQFPVSTVAGT